MNRYSIGRCFIRLAIFGLLSSVGQTLAEQSDALEMQGRVDEIHAEWSTLVINDMEYQVPPNVMVNGVTSPRAYLFNRLSEGVVVTVTAQRQNGGLRLLKIRIEQ